MFSLRFASIFCNFTSCTLSEEKSPQRGMDYFMLLTAMFSRVNIQSSNKETLGLFAPDPNQGPEDPGPATGDIALLRKADKFRLVRWGDGKFEGFWPKKAREHPRGKIDFPLRMIPWLSPDAKHPGWRLRRRARSTTAPSQTFAFFPASAGTKLSFPIKLLPLLRSRR